METMVPLSYVVAAVLSVFTALARIALHRGTLSPIVRSLADASLCGVMVLVAQPVLDLVGIGDKFIMAVAVGVGFLGVDVVSRLLSKRFGLPTPDGKENDK